MVDAAKMRKVKGAEDVQKESMSGLHQRVVGLQVYQAVEFSSCLYVYV